MGIVVSLYLSIGVNTTHAKQYKHSIVIGTFEIMVIYLFTVWVTGVVKFECIYIYTNKTENMTKYEHDSGKYKI